MSWFVIFIFSLLFHLAFDLQSAQRVQKTSQVSTSNQTNEIDQAASTIFSSQNSNQTHIHFSRCRWWHSRREYKSVDTSVRLLGVNTPETVIHANQFNVW